MEMIQWSNIIVPLIMVIICIFLLMYETEENEPEEVKMYDPWNRKEKVPFKWWFITTIKLFLCIVGMAGCFIILFLI